MPESTAADYILDCLYAWGIRYLPGFPRPCLSPLIEAMQRVPERIRFIEVCHEGTAAGMACARAKLTGALGVCLASGLGCASALTGAYDAAMEGLPMLVISGHKRHHLEEGLDPFLPIAVYSRHIPRIEDLTEVLPAAIQMAHLHRGIAHLAIPSDEISLPINAIIRPPFLPAMASLPDADVIRAMAEILGSAKRPLVVVGSGARECRQALIAFCERLSIPVACTLSAKGIFPESHPLSMGILDCPQHACRLEEWDLLLALGISSWDKEHLVPPARTIQIDPRPRIIGRGTQPEIGVVGDIKTILGELLRVMRTRFEHPPRWQHEVLNDSRAVAIANIAQTLEDVLNQDAIISLDVTDDTHHLGGEFIADRQTFLISHALAGFAGALSAKLELPARQVVCITDASAMAMVLADFLTAIRNDLVFPTLVLVDRPRPTRWGGPNFAAFAQSCGGLGLRVDDPRRLEDTLKEALRATKASLIEVTV